MRRAVLVLMLGLLACRKDKPADVDASAATAPAPSGIGSASLTADLDGGGGFGAASALESSSVDAGPLRKLESAPGAGKSADIAAGSYPSGSTPGDEGRDPSIEPALAPVSLGAYAIDLLPYPNDPAQPAKTGVTREEAARLCAEKGARLCSELEWERACKGPDGDPFATGSSWNAECDKGKETAKCASGSNVRAMGSIPEWTDSKMLVTEGEGPWVQRGGHRCAERKRASGSDGVGFRCCKGAPNTASIPAFEQKPGFKRLKMEPDELAKIFATIPELKRLGTDVKFWNAGDVNQIISRSNAAHEGISFTTQPVVWSPETGAELFVATGRGKSMSFIVALWMLPNDKYKFASSFLLVNDLSPVALAYEFPHRKELRWTACWGCAGEEGFVSYRPDEHRVVIVQR